MRLGLIFIILTNTILFLTIQAQDQRIADSLNWIYYNEKQINDSAYQELLYNITYYDSKPDTILKFSEKLIDFGIQKSNSFYLYRGLLQKGNALRLKGKFEEAAQVLFECASEAQKINDQRGVGCAYALLGDLYLSAKDHKNSLRYYHKAYEIFNILKDSILISATTFNIGSEYLNSQKPDSALFFFSNSEFYYQKLNNLSGIAYSLGNKGLAYSQLKNYQEAERNLTRAIELLKELHDMYAIASYQYGLAWMYKQKGELNKAITYAHGSYKSAYAHGLTQQVRDASKILSELYESAGDYKKALKYQAEYISIRDSIINTEKILQIADLRTEYEVAQKQTEVDLLKKKKQAQTIISASLAVIILLSIALVCILLGYNKRNKRVNKQLAEQKEELQTQRDLLEEQKEELETQNDKLTELNQTKDRFFSIISHDLRGPVSSMHGYSVVLKELLENKKHGQLLMLTDELNNSINNVSSLLDNLLNWALAQQGRFPYTPERILLSDIIDETVMNLTPMALAKNIEIINEIQPKLKVTADKNSMMTVFRNLVNNAIKFSHKGGKIEILSEKNKEFAKVTIKDYGVGIEKDRLKDIFRLKGDKSTWGTAHEKGTGLGLSLAYDFVTMNKGAIDVESEPGKGTTFILKIPLGT
ncbi:MAG: tetratricopeptide repeat-containing sensor histidine kinase [Bacteroidales bacterium]|nr:tetratricopeptide repeat-containing sensor histidine kinase [Bacteroidales bacterium]